MPHNRGLLLWYLSCNGIQKNALQFWMTPSVISMNGMHSKCQGDSLSGSEVEHVADTVLPLIARVRQ
jgi:hypothetical protein